MFGAAKLRLSGCVAGISQGWGSMTLINQQGFDGFCLQLLTRSTASRRPWVFCDQRGVMDHI